MQHLSSQIHEPLSDAALSEMESYISEALNYRHVPEFVTECARLLAEVRRLRRIVDGHLRVEEQAA